MTRRLVYSGDYGKGRSGTSRGLSPAGLCWSSAHLVQYVPNEPSWAWTQIWAPGTMPDHGLNWTATVTNVLVMQLAHPEVAQPNLEAFWFQVCLCWTTLTRVKTNSKLMPSASSTERGMSRDFQWMNWSWFDPRAAALIEIKYLSFIQD